VDDQYQTDEDTPLTTGNVLDNDDQGDTPATITDYDTTSTNGGTVAYNDNGTFDYTPAENFNGTDTFTYTITDADGDTDTATVTILVGEINDAPVAMDDTLYAVEDTTLSISAADLFGNDGTGNVNDYDVDSSSFTEIQIKSLPADGTLYLDGAVVTDEQIISVADIEAGKLTFEPDADWDGPATQFKYQVSDGSLWSNEATVTINVEPVNDPPTLEASAVHVSEEGLTGVDANPDDAPASGIHEDTTNNVIASGNINADDADGDTLTITLSDPPDNGALTSGGVAINWTGAGTDTLIGTAGADTIITISIDNSGAYSVTLSGQVDHELTDVEDYETFTVQADVSDGTVTSSADITVTIEDDSPIANDVQISAEEGSLGASASVNLVIMVDVSGSMGDPSGVGDDSRYDTTAKAILDLINEYNANTTDVKVQIVDFANTAAGLTAIDWAGNGSASWSTSGASWIDSSEFAGGDWQELSTMLENQTDPRGLYTNYDAALDFVRTNTNFSASGVTGDNVHNVSYFLSDGQPNRPSGDAGIDAGEEDTWEGFLVAEDVRAFALGMGSLESSDDLNELEPIAYDGTVDPAGLDRDGTGPTDGDALIVTDMNQLSAVLVSTVGEVIPPEPVNGNLLINSTSGADQWAGDIYPTAATVVSVTYGGSTHTFTSATDQVTYDLGNAGSVMIYGNGDYEWTPAAEVVTDSTADISFTVMDGDGDTDNAVFHLTTSGFNNPPDAVNDPTAGNDAITTPEDTPIDIDVLANDSDIDGDTITVTNVTDPPHGSVTINSDNTVEYTPDTGWIGTDTFDYTISDGEGGEDTATVTVTVLEAPEALPDSNEVTEGGPTITGNLLSNDSPVGTTLTIVNGVAVAAVGWTVVSNDTAGVLQVNAAGDYQFEVANSVSNSGGSADLVKFFNYSIEDQYGSSAQSNLAINIHDTAPETSDIKGIQIYFHSEDAGFDNVVGVYELDGNGNPVNPQIIVESTDVLQNLAGDELVFTSNDPTVKLFIIADGANQINNVGSATFGFSMSGGSATLLVNGSAYTDSEVFFMNQEWNSDGEPHIAAIPPSQTTGNTVLPNWDQPDGPALDSIPDPVVGETIFIGIEDLLGNDSDHDFNDAVLYAKGIAPEVDESALPDGTGGGALTASGNLLADHNVIPGEDTVSVTFGGQTVVLNGSGASKTATTPLGNELTITGNGAWTYTLKTNTIHPDTDVDDGDLDRGVDDQVQETINIQVIDSDGSTAPSISLKIDINDDGPEIGAPLDAIATNEIGFLVSSDLDIDFGADGPNASTSIQLSGQTNNDGFVIDNDGNELTSDGSKLVYQDDGDGGLRAVNVDTDVTVFTVAVNANDADGTGEYTVNMIGTLDTADHSITYDFDAFDGDGDVASDSFDISFEAIDSLVGTPEDPVS
jgi:hypothetical protein